VEASGTVHVKLILLTAALLRIVLEAAAHGTLNLKAFCPFLYESGAKLSI